MSFMDVWQYHTPMVIVDLSTGFFITANPGGYGTAASPMENPNEINDEKGVNWARSTVPGMSHPRYQFVAGNPRIIRFKLQYHWSFDPTAVRRECMWLQSMLYPTHAGLALLRPPAICMNVFGLHYRGVKVVFTDVKVKYGQLFQPQSLYPLRAEAECVCEEWVEQSVGPTELRIGAAV